MKGVRKPQFLLSTGGRWARVTLQAAPCQGWVFLWAERRLAGQQGGTLFLSTQ